MKVVVDDQIPLVDDFFGDSAVLVKKPGAEICREDLQDADMLWVRTITAVNKELLANTSVRFVGTATAGFDHLDTQWLAAQGIEWACSPGANAQAVVEYVLCCIAALRSQAILTAPSLRAGIIGAGRVGRLVAQQLSYLGFEVLVNDPPRAALEPDFRSTPLSEFTDLDLICVHAALTHHGDFPSYHLLDAAFFQRQQPGCVLLNAARGGIIASEVLLQQTHLHLCLDVWENEPDINLALLKKAVIATPHIAGYSVNAKKRSSLLLYQQAQAFFLQGIKPDFSPVEMAESANDLPANWEAVGLNIYNPLSHTEQMRAALLENPVQAARLFAQMRADYAWRNSFSR